MIGGMVVAGVALYAFFKSDLAKAMAERMRAGMHPKKQWSDTPIEGVADGDHVAEIEQRVTDMQGQIAEMAERLDFCGAAACAKARALTARSIGRHGDH